MVTAAIGVHPKARPDGISPKVLIGCTSISLTNSPMRNHFHSFMYNVNQMQRGRIDFALEWISRVSDGLHGPRLFEVIWHILTRVTVLRETEIAAASSVLGNSFPPYETVRIAESGLLSLIFRIKAKRAFTTFHTVNLPSSGKHSRPNFDIIVHELVHVCQFELVGSIYIWQALRAQKTDGYRYGGWQQLEKDRSKGKHFRHYNREQQGQIAQDYYNEVVVKQRLAEDPVHQAYEPFISELRKGEL